MLEVRNVFLYYDGICAVNDMSLDVAEGEIVGLIGTNGAGKTSLFNVITGFVRATTGRVGFLGRDVTGLGAARIAQSGMLRTFQTPVGFPRMTVMENMLVFSRADAAARPSIFRGATPLARSWPRRWSFWKSSAWRARPLTGYRTWPRPS